jgi:hypothetical protein
MVVPYRLEGEAKRGGPLRHCDGRAKDDGRIRRAGKTAPDADRPLLHPPGSGRGNVTIHPKPSPGPGSNRPTRESATPGFGVSYLARRLPLGNLAPGMAATGRPSDPTAASRTVGPRRGGPCMSSITF